MRDKQKGFTIVELLVVVVILSILAVIAFPTYRNYVKSAYQADAKSALLEAFGAQEQYRALNGTYTSQVTDLITKFGVKNLYGKDRGEYQVTITAADVDTFKAQANGTLDGEADCWKIDQTGDIEDCN